MGYAISLSGIGTWQAKVNAPCRSNHDDDGGLLNILLNIHSTLMKPARRVTKDETGRSEQVTRTNQKQTYQQIPSALNEAHSGGLVPGL